MAKAKLVRSTDLFLPGGWRVVIKIWELSTVKPGHRRVRYRLSLLSPSGDRVAGYDNHHPKGDHRHFMGVEERYNYKNPEILVRDFFNDVELALSRKEDS